MNELIYLGFKYGIIIGCSAFVFTYGIRLGINLLKEVK